MCPVGGVKCVFVQVSPPFKSAPWWPVRVDTTQSVRQSVRREAAESSNEILRHGPTA